MNIQDIILLLILVGCLSIAIVPIFKRKKGCCCSNCDKCQYCSKNQLCKALDNDTK